MRKIVFAVAALLIGGIQMPSAQAAQLSLVYAPDLSVPAQPSYSGGIGTAGGGLLVEFRKSKVGLELGAFYQTQLFNNVSSGNAVLTVMPKFWIGHVLNLGLGGYGGYQLTNVTANDNPLDYGLAGRAGINVPFAKSVSLMIEGGYRYGLAPQLVSTKVTLNQLTGLVGFRFGAI